MKTIGLLCLLIAVSLGTAQTFHYLKNPMGVIYSSLADPKGAIYAGGGNVYSSVDSGANWTRLGLSTLGGSGANALGMTKDGKLIACVDQSGIKILQPGNI